MLALTSVLKAPRLNKRRKNHDPTTAVDRDVSQSPSQDKTNSDDKKRRKLRAECKTITPPASIDSTTSDSISDSFVPRRSKRLAQTPAHDNDTWIECSVVNIKDRKNKKHKTRSLFYSIETQRGWWDEPPSGASNVIYLGQGGGLEVVSKGNKQRKAKRKSFE